MDTATRQKNTELHSDRREKMRELRIIEKSNKVWGIYKEDGKEDNDGMYKGTR